MRVSHSLLLTSLLAVSAFGYSPDADVSSLGEETGTDMIYRISFGSLTTSTSTYSIKLSSKDKSTAWHKMVYYIPGRSIQDIKAKGADLHPGAAPNCDEPTKCDTRIAGKEVTYGSKLISTQRAQIKAEDIGEITKVELQQDTKGTSWRIRGLKINTDSATGGKGSGNGVYYVNMPPDGMLSSPPLLHYFAITVI